MNRIRAAPHPPTNVRPHRLLLVLLYLLVAFPGSPTFATEKLIQTSIQLNWMFQFEFAGPIAALEKGFYREAGLDVRLHEGGPRVDSVTPVVEGAVDFGIAGSSLVMERFRGRPVVALAALMQHSAVGLLARRSAGIDSVFDLKGKRLATTFDTATEIEAYLKSHGIARSDYRHIDHFVPVEGLDSGQADAVAIYVSNELFHIRERIDDYILFTPRSSGIDLFGNVLFTTEKLIEKRPELVEAFRKATIRGWEYALKHQDEIADIIAAKYNTQKKSKAHLLSEASKLWELTRPDIVEPGYMYPGRWRHVADVYAGESKLPGGWDLHGFVYDPNPKTDLTWFYVGLLGTALAALIVLGIALRFRNMNRRLVAAGQEARLAQNELARSEHRFRRLFDSSPDPVWIIDGHRFVDCNQAAADMLGYPDKVLLRDIHPSDVSPERQPDGDDSRSKAERMMALADANGLHRYEWVHRRKDGSCFDTEVTLTPIALQDRSVIYCSWRDITERKRTEHALRKSEASYRELVQNVNAIIVRLGPDGTATYFNDYAERFFGYRGDEILGRQVVGTIVPAVDSRTGRDLSRMMADILDDPGTYAHNENENMTRDGRRVVVRWANQPLFDDAGHPTGLLCIGTDITAMKDAESALIQAKEIAEAANRAKSQFLATMSHEIRTPMNGILGMAQLLLMPGLDDGERHEYARIILNSGKTLLTLLNDILDLSKIEAGKVELESAVFEPQQLIRETTILFDEVGRSKGLRLEALWHGAPKARYRADTTRLRQMFANLVGNAIKFTAAGFVRLEGRDVGTDGDEALLEFSVEDSGIGIPEAKQSVLFKPFSQVDTSTTREYGGTGLGLSIVRNLASLMGGDVGVDSVPGKGSRFWFRIRARRVDDAEDGRIVSRELHAALPTGVSRQLVMVVEDNVTNRMVVEALLKKRGIRFVSVENGQDAYDRIAAGLRPTLVLMDCQMPIMDGYEATRRIRAWEAGNGMDRLPIIALTASAFGDDRLRCAEAGMDDFLTKPVDFVELAAVLDKWFETSSS